MSGAEAALLGVGILCNAMQIVTFGRDALQTYRSIRDKQTPDLNLETYLKNAKMSFDTMNHRASAASQMCPLNRIQQQIIDIGKEVFNCLDELQRKFADLYPEDALRRGMRGKLIVVQKGFKAFLYRKELDGFEKNLERNERLLNGLRLDQLCSQSEASEISSTQSFQQLDSGLKHIIARLAEGHTEISELILRQTAQEHTMTRTAVSDRVATAENNIQSSLSDAISQVRQDLLQRDQMIQIERTRKQHEKEYEQLLKSLKFPEMNSRLNHIPENYPGTFDWIFHQDSCMESNDSPSSDSKHSDDGSLRSSELTSQGHTVTEQSDDSKSCSERATAPTQQEESDYITWLESDLKLFWISGKPASGKSSLMKYISSSPLTKQYLHLWRPNVQVLKHFFWKPGQALQQSLKGMVLTLLYQILVNKPDIARLLWEARPHVRLKEEHADWDLKELMEALTWMVSTSNESYCIFLDGLDEAKELGMLPWPTWTSAQVIHDLLNMSNIKLCASSREESVFCTFFKDSLRLRIHQLNEQDIYYFANERLESSGVDSQHRVEILRMLVHASEGVFLWVALVVDSLNRAIRMRTSTFEILEECIRQTPRDIKDLLIDMWKRPGDDGTLASYHATTSRYFNLIIAAQRIDEYLAFYGTIPNFFMRSLLLMASATNNKSVESILDTGRETSVEELKARCLGVERELQVFCRGLLEVTEDDPNARDDFWHGDELLRHYHSKRIEFIHRCAYDFIMDTDIGHEMLGACGLTEDDLTARLIGGHLVRAQFVSCKHHDDHIFEMGSKIYALSSFTMASHMEATSLILSIELASTEISACNLILSTMRDWQLSGLFCQHKEWVAPVGSVVQTNSRELEFLEEIIKGDGNMMLIPYVMNLLEQYPITVLINAVPVILRALTHNGILDDEPRITSNLIERILSRLTSVHPEDKSEIWQKDRDVVKYTVRLLHSWYICRCLFWVSGYGHKDDAEFDVGVVRQCALTLLPQFAIVLSSGEDWNRPLLLELSDSKAAWFCISSHPDIPARGYRAFAIGNFLTAYRILDDFLSTQFSHTQRSNVPQEATSVFEVILIRAVRQGGVRFYAPDPQCHSQIGELLQKGLYEKDVGARDSAWSSLLQSASDGLKLVAKNTDEAFIYLGNKLEEQNLSPVQPWSPGWVIRES